ncbi:phosphohydrolase, partial [bacterium]|nr:phosphohydrolase [bacterium]
MRDDEALAILSRFYDSSSRAFALLKTHGELVADKALAAAATVAHLQPDLGFVRSAALLHDIGIFLTRCPG